MAGHATTTALSDVRFVGLRFRLVTRGVQRPAPVEVAALAHHGIGDLVSWRAHAVIEPPEPGSPPPAPITAPVPPAEPGSLAEALAAIDRRISGDHPHALIAVPPFAETTIIREQRAYCAALASCVVLDLMTLAAVVRPTATPQSLDNRLRAIGLQPPQDRAATWDAYAVTHLFHTLVGEGIAGRRWSTLEDLARTAGTYPPPIEPEFLPPSDVQESLFD
ncbi:hypothetical protein [Embleya sp. MST-111070]|uniref:hypothetical protein n=1 Tax=Embleya sp. MST-111070 TaxID=3398231 RepID=UPI003F73523A